MNELIVIKQLPIIEERLKGLKQEIKKKVATANALVCTEDTVKEVKATRAELNKEFTQLEEQRKAVKSAVMKPYEEFEKVYCEYVSMLYKSADVDLKDKIAQVENGLKKERKSGIDAYLTEYAQSRNVDLSFVKNDVNVTLSASLKSLKDQTRLAVDKAFDDLAMISTQEYCEEILLEYKKSFNASQSILTVSNRHKEIEALEEQKNARQAQIIESEKAVQKVEEVLTVPDVISVPEVIEEEPELTLTFTVTATREKLKELKQFLINGGYKYE